MEAFLDRFYKGVWGEHARINNSYNGGPECAQQIPLQFILFTIVVLTPLYYVSVRAGLNKITALYRDKYDDLKRRNMLAPTRLEKLMGFVCILCTLANIYYKYESSTLIFMFNPCHVVCMALIVPAFTNFSIKSELVALYIFSSAFGGWIGLIFSENEEMSSAELLVYYTEHSLASFLGPLVLCLGGRFDPLAYAGWPLPACGFHLFCIYMRYVLTPLSQLTWANLNHTLCGVGNDPFYEQLDLGYTFYFWADFYLLFSCYVGIVLNFAICYVVKSIVGDFFERKAPGSSQAQSGKKIN